MSISVVTFANLGRKQNLKTPDIIPLLEKLQKEGVLGQVIFQLGTDVPYTNAVSAVPKLIRYIFGALRRIRVYPPRHLEETVFDFFACRKLAPASVVFFHGGYFLPRTVRRARAQGAIVIDLAVSAHPKTNASLEREELAYLELKGFEASYMRVEKESRHVNAFDYVIGMSPFVKQTYVDAGFSEDRVFVASPDIDLKRFTPGHTSPKEFEILYMAHTQPLKGLHYLLDAWEIIKFNDAKLIVVGGFAAMPSALRKRYVSRMHSLAVSYVPGTHTPEDNFRTASVLVFPSLTEGFGRVTLEAMACGIPVITTENARGIVEDGKTGFVVPIRDAKALAEKIQYLYDNREIASEMGRQARLAVEKKKPFGEAVYEIYQEILKREGKSL